MSNRQGGQTRLACTEEGCTVTFSRKKDLERHEDEKHGEMKFCSQPGCNYRGTKRASRLKAHMESHHPELYNVPIIVPEQTSPGNFEYDDQPQVSPPVTAPDMRSLDYPGAYAPYQEPLQSPQYYQDQPNSTWPPTYYPESGYHATLPSNPAGFHGNITYTTNDNSVNDLNQDPSSDNQHYTYRQL